MKYATSMMGVPTFYTRLLASDDLNTDATHHIRLFISGSAPLLSETHIEFERRTGKKILERYGMTETNMNTSNPYDGERKAGTVGTPLPGVEIRVVNEEGHLVEHGKIGTIELKGENVFSGYWGMKEKTKEAFKKDGFFITGDLAQRDEDGYLIIVGRDKDMIISGGLNVYPKEIEDAINEMPNILESAVVGIQHHDFGEAVIAVVVSSDKTLAEIKVLDFLIDKIAKYKQPKRILFLDELPRNTMGEVQKKVLRENYSDLFKN